MRHTNDAVELAIERPCLQCRAVIDFDLASATVRHGHVRMRAACPECGARHCLLPDWDVYGLVAAGAEAVKRP